MACRVLIGDERAIGMCLLLAVEGLHRNVFLGRTSLALLSELHPLLARQGTHAPVERADEFHILSCTNRFG